MIDEKQAAILIRNFLETIKGLHELAPGLESLAELKQKECEARARLQQMELSLGKVMGELQAARKEHSHVKAICARDLKRVKDDIAAERAEAASLRSGAIK